MSTPTPCPDRASLERLLRGEIPFPDGESLYSHLGECDRCAEHARSLQAEDVLSAAVRGAAAADPADHASVLGLIAALERRGPPAALVDGPATALSDTTPPRGEAADTSRELFDFLAPAQGPGELGRLGDYRILKVLGSGGMGVVFHAEDPALERPVAVKAMLPNLAASAAARRRFLREGRAAAALHHDHIVPIFQVGEDRGVPYIAMPLLRGESLEDRLKREGAVPPAEAFRIGREIALGLAAAHARRLVHRDIKPGNVWLESDAEDGEPANGRVKILDFGLARPVSDAGLTQEGAIVGTPAFMAPEQAGGQPVDARSDLFSLGCVLYRMTTGEVPFKGNDAVSTLLAVAREHPRPPAEVHPAVPLPLSALVMRLLAKNPADRPASAREVIERLAQAEVEAAAPPPRTPAWGWRRWAPLVFAAVLGFGAVAAMGLHITVPTDHGDVTIETDDPNIEVVATKGGKLIRIVDPQSKQTWELDPEKYELRMADQPDGLVIELDGKGPFVLKRRGEKLVTIARGEEAKDVKVGEVFRQHWDGHVNSTVDLSPDGRMVVGGYWGKTRVWDVATGKPLYDLDGWVAQFTPDGKRIVTGEKSVLVYDAFSGKLLRRCDLDPTGGFWDIAGCSDGKAHTVSNDRMHRLWDLETGELVKSWSFDEKPPPEAGDADYSCTNRGPRKFNAGEFGFIFVADRDTGKQVAKLWAKNFEPKRLAISQDGRFAAACASNLESDLVVWRLPDPAPPQPTEP